jgi:hypothetical protein
MKPENLKLHRLPTEETANKLPSMMRPNPLATTLTGRGSAARFQV